MRKTSLISSFILISLIFSGINAQSLSLSFNKPDVPVKITLGGSEGDIITIRRGNHESHYSLDSKRKEIEILDSGKVVIIEGPVTYLKCIAQEVIEVSISNGHPINTLLLASNMMSTFIAPELPQLSLLNLSGNKISEIDLSNCVNLTNVNLNSNIISSLDLSKCNKLSRVQFSNNNLNACSLNALYRLLPRLTTRPSSPNLFNAKSTDSNDALHSNTAIAIEKNWLPNISGDASGCPEDEEKNFEGLSFTTDASNKITILLGFFANNKKHFYIDWGDNKKVEYQEQQNEYGDPIKISGKPVGTKKIKIYAQLKIFENSNGDITSINISKQPKLEKLKVYYGKLNTIDISNNKKLKELYLRNNKLHFIDLSNCPELEKLYIRENLLSDIDLTKVPKLKELAISHNKLSSLDITKVPLLEKLIAYNIGIRSLDLSKCPKIYQIEVPGNDLSDLDFSNCKEINHINIEHNNFSACDLNRMYRTLPTLTRPVGWKNLINNGDTNDAKHSDTSIAELKGWKPNVKGDGTGCDKDNYKISDNRVTLQTTREDGNWLLGISFTDYKTVWIDWNNNNVYDEGEAIKEDYIANRLIHKIENKKINIYGSIKQFICDSQYLDELKFENQKHLETLNCSWNPSIKQLSIKSMKKLKYLNVEKTGISALDLDGISNLQKLHASFNNINAISIKACGMLEEINLSNNQLKNIDFTGMQKIKRILLDNNKIEEIILENPTITYLSLAGNKLKTLDISKLSEIDTLWCNNNQLKGLDIPSSSKLEFISIYSNQLSSNTLGHIFNNLPNRKDIAVYASIIVINEADKSEKNICYKSQVNKLKEKYWLALDSNNGNAKYYPGIDDTGIEDVFSKNIEVYPLLTDGEITIHSPINSLIKVFSTDGTIVLKKYTMDKTTTINISHLPSNIYILIINNKLYKINKR